MSVLLRMRPIHVVGTVLVLVALAVVVETATGQAGGIGARGSQTVTTVPVTSGVPTTPAIPSNVNLTPAATNSLAKGLDQSGTALRPGMGWLVRDVNRRGVKGREVADVIHELKPYRAQGRITMPPQNVGNAAPQPQQPGGLFPRIEGRIDSIG